MPVAPAHLSGPPALTRRRPTLPMVLVAGVVALVVLGVGYLAFNAGRSADVVSPTVGVDAARAYSASAAADKKRLADVWNAAAS
jgi:CHASE2 domain-containing sensor protein